MPNIAKRFRDRALDCRNLAKSARTALDREMLEDIAADLEDEAKRIDRGDANLQDNEPPR